MGKILSLCLLSLMFVSSFAYAENDAPHNNSNNISCSSCHDQGLTSSPFWSANPDDDTYNNFCLLNCHDAAFGPYTDTSAPSVLPHNSTTTSNTYGTWSVSCIECHNPHDQHQIGFKNSDSSLYWLASGSTTTPKPTHDDANNTSLINYSSLNYRSGWDADSLVGKSGSYRRPIIYPNTKKTGYS